MDNLAQTTTPQQPQQDQAPSPLIFTAIESTIIDIPAVVVVVDASATLSASALSSSLSTTSYDTDSSTASSTCCTRDGEHIYMQRIINTSSSAAAAANASSSGNTANKRQLPQEEDVGYYKADHSNNWPTFILLISIIEITIFIYDYLSVERPIDKSIRVQIVPDDSVLIYRPDRRIQLWRFLSYMFLHANWVHLGFNIIVQLFFGIPLEVMHGSARVAIIYFAGVFAGSLGTSVVDSDVYLLGASGGVYALLAAHLANLTLNYSQMQQASTQLGSVVIFVVCDLSYIFYTHVIDVPRHHVGPTVSYIAHITGSLAGLTIGLLVLKNFERPAYKNLIWWLALGVYSAFTVFAIAFNLINTETAQLIEEQGEVITQHLMHDLGVS